MFVAEEPRRSTTSRTVVTDPSRRKKITRRKKKGFRVLSVFGPPRRFYILKIISEENIIIGEQE